MRRVGTGMAVMLAGFQVFVLLRLLFDPRVARPLTPSAGVSLVALAVSAGCIAVSVRWARRAGPAAGNRRREFAWAAAAAAWVGVLAPLAITTLA